MAQMSLVLIHLRSLALQCEQSHIEQGTKRGFEALTLQLNKEKERSESLLYRSVVPQRRLGLLLLLLQSLLTNSFSSIPCFMR